MRSPLPVLILIGAACLPGLTPPALGSPPGLPELPIAPPQRTVDTYWEQEVVDNYQYLERTTDAGVMEWAAGQNAYTRAWLDDYPHRTQLAERVKVLTHSASPDYYYLSRAGDRLFAIKRQPPKEQSFLVLLSSLTSTEGQRVIVDPNIIDPEGRTSIDFYEPSHDGRYVAVSLSKDGTEDGTVHVYDVDSGQRLGDAIPRVNGGTAGGSVAWNATNDGFFYSRYPYPGEREPADLHFYQQIWYHQLGTPLTADHYVLGESFPRIAEIDLETSDDGRFIIAEVSYGDGGEYEFWLKAPETEWTRFARFEDWVQGAHFGADGAIYLLSRKDAPRKRILRLTVEEPEVAKAVTVVPESETVITGFVAGASRIYVTEMVGGPIQLHAYDLSGHSLGVIDMGEYCSISGLERMAGDRLLFRRETYTTPATWFDYAPGMATPVATALVKTSPADFSDCEVRRIFATADDGTRFPINIIMRKGVSLDGSAPMILYGYGSYGISQRPKFHASRLIWIEQGGMHAIASIRGGGEYGDAWHRAANLEHKKVSMDDFAACARHLVDEGYTSRDRLAIRGGSAGGLLVYGTMAHYPELMAAVISSVGISDALRTELTPNGEFNITEFGTVKDEKLFPGMLAASPLHQLRDGVQYPAVFSLTGMNDPRVNPWQTFKMTARLQATGTERPVLMRVSQNTGHGGGTALSEKDAQLVDWLSFLFKLMGLDYRPQGRTGQQSD